MTDIVERLRSDPHRVSTGLVLEAAAEIERLRDALTQIEGCFSSVEAAAAVTRERITDALDGYLWIDPSGDEG